MIMSSVFDDRFEMVDEEYLLSHGYKRSIKYPGYYTKMLNTIGIEIHQNTTHYYNIGIVIGPESIMIVDCDYDFEIMHWDNQRYECLAIKNFLRDMDVMTLETIELTFSKDIYKHEEWISLVSKY